MVLSRIGKKAPRNTRKIADLAPRPKKIIDSGSHAVTGIGRNSDSVGSSSARSSGMRPIIRPIGMPSNAAQKKPP